MKQKKTAKWFLVLTLSVCCTLFAAGCKKQEEPAAEEPLSVSETEDPVVQGTIEEIEIVDTHEGQAKSLLSGTWIDEELAKKRPVAVMIGNTSDALPQYGIAQADVIYEAPVEGALTRLMPIYQDYSNLSAIGSVRSCREYYARYALEFDALYAHYGQASYAEGFLSQDYVNNLSGLDSSVESVMYYRDSSRKSPHNAFTSTDGILAGIDAKGYRTEYEEDYTGHYRFAEDDSPVVLEAGTDATMIYPGYLVNKPWFEYNAEDGLYYRYQYGAKHIDGATGEQLAVTNIIMQISQWSVIDSEAGYLEITTIDTGRGWYFTGGKAIPVTWEKTDKFSPTRYYDENGDEIVLNQGKTWVCIIQDSYADNLTFSDGE